MRSRSLRWWLLAVLFAVFALLIKPAGGVLIVAINVAWGCALSIEYLRTDRAAKKQLQNLLATGTLAAVLIEAEVVLLCLHSKYLSQENIAAGARSLRTFQTIF